MGSLVRAERRHGGVSENFGGSSYANSPRGAATAAVEARIFFGGVCIQPADHACAPMIFHHHTLSPRV
jgi:hypothetical protein